MKDSGRFYSCLKKVAVIHVVAVVLLMFWGVLGSIFKEKKPVVIPIEFIVAVPSSSSQAIEAAVIQKVPKPIPKPKPKPQPKPKPKPRPSPTERIKVNNQRVRRDNSNAAPPDELLSPEEIARRLRMGARAGKVNTAIPDEDSRGFILIKQTMYDLWQPPDKEAVGNKVAKVTLKLSSNGALVYKKLVSPSGVALMDQSVSTALAAVVRIPGLPAGFLKRHRNESITITFKVE